MLELACLLHDLAAGDGDAGPADARVPESLQVPLAGLCDDVPHPVDSVIALLLQAQGFWEGLSTLLGWRAYPSGPMVHQRSSIRVNTHY